MAVLFTASSPIFCLYTIIYDPLHLDWHNFARTCVLTTSKILLNIKVIGQKSKSHDFLCFSCVHDTTWTSRPGFTKCHSLNCATLLAGLPYIWNLPSISISIFTDFPWISMDISMDIYGYIDIHIRLSYVHIATEFSQNTAVPERTFPQAFLWNC